MQKKGFLYVKRRFLRTVKSCSNKRCFGCENEMLLRAKRKAVCKWKTFGLRKRTAFTAPAKLSDKEKNFFQRITTPTSHCTKANAQLQISSAITYCELAVQQSFFEKSQSCVSCTVTLLHRFKAFTLPFCRQNRFRQKPPENFAKLLPAEL